MTTSQASHSKAACCGLYIPNLKKAFSELEYPDVAHVEAGLINVNGFKIAMPNQFYDRMWGPLFEDVFFGGTVDKNDSDTWETFALKFFEKVFDSAGAARPQNLHGFPQQE